MTKELMVKIKEPIIKLMLERGKASKQNQCASRIPTQDNSLGSRSRESESPDRQYDKNLPLKRIHKNVMTTFCWAMLVQDAGLFYCFIYYWQRDA